MNIVEYPTPNSKAVVTARCNNSSAKSSKSGGKVFYCYFHIYKMEENYWFNFFSQSV